MFKIVGDVDDKIVSPVGDDGWARNCAVEGQCLACVSVWRECCVFNREPVFYLRSVMESKRIECSKLELPLVTPVDGVVVYQSVSMEYSPQQDLDVAVFSQEEFWRAVRVEGKVSEVKGIAEVNECKANEAKKVTSVVFMMKEEILFLY